MEELKHSVTSLSVLMYSLMNGSENVACRKLLSRHIHLRLFAYGYTNYRKASELNHKRGTTFRLCSYRLLRR